MKKNKIVYIAIPFTSDSEMIKNLRFAMANKVSAHYMEQGEIVFSPVSMGWPIQKASKNGITTEWSYWKAACTTYLKASYKMVVIMMDGWLESTGVQAEIVIAKELKLEIEYVKPEDFLS